LCLVTQARAASTESGGSLADLARSDGDGFCVFIHLNSDQYCILNSINQSDD
jgi:hypothetical protein